MNLDKDFLAISKRAGKAIGDYGMLQDGDRVLVGVSGGKDSLTLLHILLYRQQFIPIKIRIVAVYVDAGIPGFPLDKLIKHFQMLGVEYLVEKIDLLKGQKTKNIDCFWCSWSRRKALFNLAEKMGFNKIAFGHHLDDIVETVLLNLCFRGEVSAMRPKQVLFKGKLAVIRPLAYESEATIARFAKAAKLNNLCRCRCPHSATSKRAAMKRILQMLEKENTDAKINIFRSLQNIKKDYLLDEVSESSFE